MKLFLLTFFFWPALVFGQAGTPMIVGPWAVLNEAADIRSGDAGCYSSSQVKFAKNALTISQVGGSYTCGYSNSQNSPSTGTTVQSYLSGSVVWNTLNYTPSAGHNLVFVVSAKMGHGLPAIWFLGAGCQATSKYTWDNYSTCNWAQDSSDSSEIDMAEAGPGSSHYGDVANNVFTGSGSALNGGCDGPNVSDVTQNFHTYSMVWTTSTLTLYTDGVSTCSYSSGIPHNAMFLIMESRQQSGNIDNPSPNIMTVQYVQVCDAGSGTTCTTQGSAGGNDVFFDDFSTYAAPVVYFTDLTSGPTPADKTTTEPS